MLREIISLQFGHYANHVGAHWWNIQQSYFCHHASELNEVHHDVLFREGQTLKSEVTFTPRLVAVDVSGSITHLRATGAYLYHGGIDQNDIGAAWCHQTEVHKQESAATSDSLRRLDQSEDIDSERDGTGLDGECDVTSGDAETVTVEPDDVYKAGGSDFSVWCDYLRVHLHPRSLLLTPQYQLNNNSRAFDLFSYGVEQYNRDEFGEHIEDRIRQYAEECDAFSGFHVLHDVDGGFGGVSACTLSHLSDEYPGRPLLSVPLYEYKQYTDIPQAVHAIVNCLLSLDNDASHATMCVPLSVCEHWPSPRSYAHRPSQNRFAHLQFYPELRYHSSALLAAALDSLTLPWRLRSDCVRHPVGDWSIPADSLVGVANEMTSHGVLVAGCSALPLLSESAATCDRLPFQCLTPGAGADSRQRRHWARGTVVLRGVPDSWRPDETGRWSVLAAPSPLRLSPPFPAIVNPTGSITASNTSKRCVAAGAMLLSSPSSIARSLDSLTASASKLRPDKLHRFVAAGMHADELSEALERLLTLSAHYTDN